MLLQVKVINGNGHILHRQTALANIVQSGCAPGHPLYSTGLGPPQPPRLGLLSPFAHKAPLLAQAEPTWKRWTIGEWIGFHGDLSQSCFSCVSNSLQLDLLPSKSISASIRRCKSARSCFIHSRSSSIRSILSINVGSPGFLTRYEDGSSSGTLNVALSAKSPPPNTSHLASTPRKPATSSSVSGFGTDPSNHRETVDRATPQ